MTIFFVNRFFHPDISATSQLLTDLAGHLAKSSEVHVITSRLLYDTPGEPLPAEASVAGVRVHRVWTSRFGRTTLVGRAMDYATFYVAATLAIIRLVNRGDVVVAMTDPPLISVAAYAAAWLRGAALVNWLHDLFPEVAGALGVAWCRGRSGRVLGWLRDCSLRAAVGNVVLGDRMARVVAARGIPGDRIQLIHNWSPDERITPLEPEFNSLRQTWKLEGKFVVGYSGNIGRAHDFGVLLEAATRLSGRDDIAFLFIGGGNQRVALEAEVRSRGLGNVCFRPYQPPNLLAQSLTAPDCHVVSLKPELEGLIVPSKLYGCLAAGRPVVFIGAHDGEIAALMRSSFAPFGVCVSPDDVSELTREIERLVDDPAYGRLLGANGRRLFDERFNRALALDAWAALFAGR